MKTYRIYLFRHGLTAGNFNAQYIGSTDEPLDPRGEAQLQRLSGAHPYPPVDAVFTSPLRRARQSAAILYPNHSAIALDGLKECDFGEFEGKTAAELQGDARFAKWLSGDLRARPPQGESGAEFTARVGRKSVTIDTAKMKIRGLHNAYNAMAAALATLAAGVEPESVARSIYGFDPVEHRLEPAGERDGVLWINDSKATNVDSVWYALESMTRPVVWIAGGTDKGNDYGPLKEFARAKVKCLVCMGVDNAKLVESFTGVVPEVVSTSSLDEAMRAAAARATAGDVVLLSPACASFDLFKNYEPRGELFKQWVSDNVLNK